MGTRLRLLLVLVGLVIFLGGVLLGTLGRSLFSRGPEPDPPGAKVEEPRDEAGVIAVLESRGGTVERFNGRIARMDLTHTRLKDSELRWLAMVKDLIQVDLPSSITNEGLAHLAGISIRGLSLPEGVSDKGLEIVSEWKQLTVLQISSKRISNKGLEHLRALNLRVLSISDAPITDDALRALDGMTDLLALSLHRTTVAELKGLRSHKRLNTLSLYGSPIRDAALDELRAMDSLLSLDMSRTEITDKGLRGLSALTNLRKLDLSKTVVTDAGLAELKSLTNLATLDLTDTGVTKEGINDFKAAVPECRVSR